MNLDVEFVADQPRQLPSANRLAWDQPRLQERQNLAANLVRTAWAWLLWDQSSNPCRIEVRLGLVVGWPGNAILVGNVRHGNGVDGDATQHPVLDLDGVARVEELASPKLWIAHLLGRRIERALFEEGICATSSRASPTTRSIASPICCHGIGSPQRRSPKQLKGPSPSGYRAGGRLHGLPTRR